MKEISVLLLSLSNLHGMQRMGKSRTAIWWFEETATNPIRFGPCHPEQSEGSVFAEPNQKQMLRSAQHDRQEAVAFFEKRSAEEMRVLKSSPPKALIGGPVRIPPGFPLKACGNDGTGGIRS